MKIIKERHNKVNTEAKEYFFSNFKKGDSINVMQTAKSLNVSRQTLHRWINAINGGEKY